MANEEVNAPETGGETNEPTLSEPVSSILTRTREAKGLTIDDIDSVTHISPGWVSVMEKGDWNQYPSMVYARGHVKVYAEHLDLDVPSILAAFQKDWARTVAPDPGESPSSASVRPPAWSRPRGGDARLYWIAGGIVLVLIVGGLAAKHERKTTKRLPSPPLTFSSTAPSSPAPPVPPASPSAGTSVPAPATGSSAPAPSPSASSPSSPPEASGKPPVPVQPAVPSSGASPAPAVPAGRLTLRMVGLKSVWVVISVDDGTVRHFRLNPGDERTLVGKNFMTFSTQSGDGLALFLNGKRLGLAGPNAQPVLHRRINRQSLRHMKSLKSPSLAPRKSLSASSGVSRKKSPEGTPGKGVPSPAAGTQSPARVKTVPLVPSPSSGGNSGSPGSPSPLFPSSPGGQN